MRSIAQRSKQNKILWSEVEQDVRNGYKRINATYPPGVIFPHYESQLLNGFVNEIAGG